MSKTETLCRLINCDVCNEVLNKKSHNKHLRTKKHLTNQEKVKTTNELEHEFHTERKEINETELHEKEKQEQLNANFKNYILKPYREHMEAPIDIESLHGKHF